jgi:DNA-binding transcriptional ArsR family regulator
MKSRPPVEVVVIRDLVLRTPCPEPVEGPPPPPPCPEPARGEPAEPAYPEPVEEVEGPPPPSAPDPPTRFSPEQGDDLQAVHDAADWSVRRDLLVALGQCDGPIHVAALAERAGIDQNTVSHHLKPLRDAGYVRRRRQGRHTFYTAVAARVRVNRGPEGLSLTLIHASGAYVTHGVPMPKPPPAAEPPQRAEPPRAAEPTGGETIQGEVVHE